MTRVLVEAAAADSWLKRAGGTAARPFAILMIAALGSAGFAPRGVGAAEPLRSDSRAYAERADAVDLARAEQAFVSGDPVAGVSHLRRLLDRSFDSFVSINGQTSGARVAVEGLLRRQPAGIRQFYESAETAAAVGALQLAKEEGSPESIRRVVLRFPSTEPAFEAADRLAVIAFDEGDFATAARLWEEMLADPRHANRVTPAAAARLLTALRVTGRDGRASELAVRFAGVPLRLEGQTATVGSLLAGISPSSVPFPMTAEPGTAGPALSPPAFPPVWEEGASADRDLLLELWAANRRMEARPLAVPAGAVWTASGIFVRRLGGLAALDPSTGNQLWTFAGLADSVPGHDSDPLDLTRFETDYAGVGVYGRLAADAERVYVVDRVSDPPAVEVRTASHVPIPSYNQQPAGDGANCLSAIAVTTGPDGPRPAWTVGGRAEGTPLADHYFFGPPCVTASGLLVLAEHRQCLSLIALKPSTGAVLWQQPLGYVTRPVSADLERAAAACQPAVTGGIAVCGTNAGFAVAFDCTSRRLQWAYDYNATESDPRHGQDGHGERMCYYGDASFPCPVIIRGDNVILLPHDSRRVHCLDLRNGSVRWTAPREDGLYVGCVTEASALLVGRSRCRSLSIAGGSPLWSARFGTPSGTGLATEAAYLLPLEDGRIVAIDLARGSRVGFDLPRTGDDFRAVAEEAVDIAYSNRWRPGNLYTDGQTLLSVGPSGVTRLRTAGEVSRLADATMPALDRARIELAAGRSEVAKPRLESLMTEAKSAAESEEARVLLRELHYSRLDGTAGNDGEALAELDRLSVTPAERGRFLLRAAERDLAVEDMASLLGRAGELAGLTLPGALPSPQDPTLLVTSASWVPALIRRCPERREPPRWDQATLESFPIEELNRRLAFLAGGPEADAVRLELARRAVADGELQHAELLLLQNLEDGVCVESCRELDELRHSLGLDGFAPRAAIPSRAVSSVKVTGQLWSPADDGVCRAYGGMRRDFLMRGRDPFRVVDRGDSRQSRLAVVDLAGGVCLGEVTIDSRLRFPLLNRQPRHGHFVPVATVGRLNGLSLLEVHRGEPVWTADLPGSDGVLPQVGPYGPSFCTVQTRRELTTFDPTTGAVLWQRRELPPDRGLHGDQAAGLFGDGQTLTMLDADGTSYTAYRTRTGEEYGSGRLPMDRQRQRRAYGRKLFFVETGEDGRSTARLWDPLTNSYELAIGFEGRLLQTSREDELVLLFCDGRLLIYDTAVGSAALDVQLSPADVASAHTLCVFADAERYYVSLYHADPRRFEEPKVASFIYDTPLSAAHVQGRLVAIDRHSGETLWSRTTDQRSVIDPIDHPTPFLVGVARVSDRRFGNRKTLLVEAIDKRSGATLGLNDVLVPDQPLQVRTSDDQVELAGMTSKVVLDFGPDQPAEEALALRAFRRVR